MEAKIKACIKCHEEHKESHYKSGKHIRGECKSCRNKDLNERRQKYKEKAASITKTCKVCKTVKDGTNFTYNSLTCKSCLSEINKESNHKPAEDAPNKTCKTCSKEQPAKNYRYQNNECRTCEKERLYKWRQNNPDKFKKICKTYREKDDYREKMNTYRRNKYNTDVQERLRLLYRNRVRNFYKRGYTSVKANEYYTKMLGCTYETLRKWLEFNFKEGMTWENAGSDWHIDHTYPCSLFDLTTKENRNTCFHWSNLAPMFGLENLSKSNKLDMELINYYKKRAIEFIEAHSLIGILTERLPLELQVASGVLETKDSVKALSGSG